MKTKTFKIDLPKLYEKMDKFVNSPKRFSLCIGSTQIGKSSSLIIWIIKLAIENPGRRDYIWVSPTYSQSLSAFERAQKMFVGSEKIFNYNKSEMFIELPNKSKIWFRTGDNPANIMGWTYWGAVIDEATLCKEELRSVIFTRLGKTNGPMRAIANATTFNNWFYKLWIDIKNNPNNYKDYDAHQITCYDAMDAGVKTKKEIEEAKALLPEHEFNCLYMGKPSETGGNPFGFAKIEDCLQPLSSRPAVTYGIDIGKVNDYTVITGLDENKQVCYFDRFNGLTYDVQIERIWKIIRNTPTVVDNTGVGAGIVDSLVKYSCNIVPFNFTPSSKQMLIGNLIVAIQNKDIGFPTGIIEDELKSFAYKIKENRIIYEGTPHDDAVCSLALALEGFKHRKPDVGFVPLVDEDEDYDDDDENETAVKVIKVNF